MIKWDMRAYIDLKKKWDAYNFSPHEEQGFPNGSRVQI